MSVLNYVTNDCVLKEPNKKMGEFRSNPQAL